MAQFKVTVMNWVPLCVSPVTAATKWSQLVHHSELVSPMAKEEGNGQNWILFANVSLSKTVVVLFFNGLMTKSTWLVRSSPDRAVWVRPLAGDIALCSWARHFTLTVPLFTQVYKWVPANLMLGGNPAMD